MQFWGLAFTLFCLSAFPAAAQLPGVAPDTAGPNKPNPPQGSTTTPDSQAPKKDEAPAAQSGIQMTEEEWKSQSGRNVVTGQPPLPR